MENTLENKIVFMAQYYGQQIVSNEHLLNMGVKTFVNDKSMLIDNYLELTPLHLISDEEAIELVKIIHGKSHVNNIFYVLSKEKALFEIHLSVKNSTTFLKYDFLRSKGYALYFNGLSVEEQVSRGWVVLKTKI